MQEQRSSKTYEKKKDSSSPWPMRRRKQGRGNDGWKSSDEQCGGRKISRKGKAVQAVVEADSALAVTHCVPEATAGSSSMDGFVLASPDSGFCRLICLGLQEN